MFLSLLFLLNIFAKTFHRQVSQIHYNGQVGLLNHSTFLKQKLGVRHQTADLVDYSELGRVPFFVLMKIWILKYWYKIFSWHSQGSLVHKVYAEQVNEFNSGINEKNWAFLVKSILDELGFSYLWNDPNITKLQLEYGYSMFVWPIFSKLVW